MARFGEAGASFNDPELHRKFGKNAIIGQQGERYYGHALDRAAISSNYLVHGSLNIPNVRGGARYTSDVDFAVANGNTLVLIDVKKWEGGQFYWSFMGFPFKGLTPMMKNGRWRLSQNMAAALSRYRENLPGVHVEAMVVFVPSNAKGKLPASVGFLRWPGGIRSFLSGDSIYRLNKVLGVPETVTPSIQSLLSRMTRH